LDDLKLDPILKLLLRWQCFHTSSTITPSNTFKLSLKWTYSSSILLRLRVESLEELLIRESKLLPLSKFSEFKNVRISSYHLKIYGSFQGMILINVCLLYALVYTNKNWAYLFPSELSKLRISIFWSANPSDLTFQTENKISVKFSKWPSVCNEISVLGSIVNLSISCSNFENMGNIFDMLENESEVLDLFAKLFLWCR